MTLFDQEIPEPEVVQKLSYVIYGEPKPKQGSKQRFIPGNANRPGFIRNYQPAKVVEAENNIKNQIIKQHHEQFGPTAIGDCLRVTRLLFAFSPKKSWTKKKHAALESGATIYKATKPDLTDNLNKGLFDAMEGIVYQNDSQIAEICNSKKVYSNTPRIEVDFEIIDKRYVG